MRWNFNDVLTGRVLNVYWLSKCLPAIIFLGFPVLRKWHKAVLSLFSCFLKHGSCSKQKQRSTYLETIWMVHAYLSLKYMQTKFTKKRIKTFYFAFQRIGFKIRLMNREDFWLLKFLSSKYRLLHYIESRKSPQILKGKKRGGEQGGSPSRKRKIGTHVNFIKTLQNIVSLSR